MDNFWLYVNAWTIQELIFNAKDAMPLEKNVYMNQRSKKESYFGYTSINFFTTFSNFCMLCFFPKFDFNFLTSSISLASLDKLQDRPIKMYRCTLCSAFDEKK